MREILFKAKRLDNGEWVEGHLAKGKWYLNDNEMTVIFSDDLDFFPHSEISSYYEVDPKTVCQYTGLKDMNGKKIWENDIVKMSIIHYSTRKEIVSATTKVGFVNGQFGVVWGHRKEFSSFDGFVEGLTTIEVVGNIFDEVTE